MGYNEVIKKLKKLGAKILPPDARLFLYGSRARGDYKENSDWDLLLILNRPKKNDDYEKIAYPLMELGFDLGQYFSVHTYSNDEWEGMSFLPFYKNVERDKIALVWVWVMREQSDYNCTFNATEEEITPLIPLTGEFIETVLGMIKA